MFLTEKACNLIVGDNAPLARIANFFSRRDLIMVSERIGGALNVKDIHTLFHEDGDLVVCESCRKKWEERGEEIVAFRPVSALLLNRNDGTVCKKKDSGEPVERGNFLVIKRGRDISVQAFCDKCIREDSVRITSNMKRLPAQSRRQASQRAEHLKKMFEPKESSPRLAEKPSKGMTAPILKKPLEKALEEEVGASA